MTAFTFENNQPKKKETADPKEQEARQKKTQVLFNGQHAVSKLREAFDMLSNSLGLQVSSWCICLSNPNHTLTLMLCLLLLLHDGKSGLRLNDCTILNLT